MPLTSTFRVHTCGSKLTEAAVLPTRRSIHAPTGRRLLVRQEVGALVPQHAPQGDSPAIEARPVLDTARALELHSITPKLRLGERSANICEHLCSQSAVSTALAALEHTFGF